MTNSPLRYTFAVLWTAATVVLSGCGGGSSSGLTDEPAWMPPVPTILNTINFVDYLANSAEQNETSNVTAVSDDGAGGFNVTLVVDGVEHEVHFDASERDQFGGYTDANGAPNYGFWFWEASQFLRGSSEPTHFDVYGWQAGERSGGTLETQYRGYVVIGNPTDVLPLGTATYEGRSRWDDFLRDDSNSGRRRSVSDVTLNIDFDSATVDGVFDNFEHWTSGAPRVQSDTVLRIENGEITSTGFSARLAQDMAPTSTFAGTMTGQFFGSDADEAGGAIEGSSDARVFIGWFEGTKD